METTFKKKVCDFITTHRKQINGTVFEILSDPPFNEWHARFTKSD